MRRLWTLLALWAILYGWSFVAFLSTDPTGDGFTRGINRVTQLVIWQYWAAIVAFIISVRARRMAVQMRFRLLFRVPLILAAVFGLVLIGALIWGTAG